MKYKPNPSSNYQISIVKQMPLKLARTKDSTGEVSEPIKIAISSCVQLNAKKQLSRVQETVDMKYELRTALNENRNNDWSVNNGEDN